MTTPYPPESGKFVTADEVIARFEGNFPSDRVAWLKWRIGDVENELMGQVKSLRKPLVDIIADSDEVGDPGRVERVKTLVIDKLLSLHRNPDGSTSVRSEMDGFAETRGYGQSRLSVASGITFTTEEIDRVRLQNPTQRRPHIGTYGVRPAVF